MANAPLPARFLGIPQLLKNCPSCRGRHFMTFEQSGAWQRAVCPKTGAFMSGIHKSNANTLGDVWLVNYGDYGFVV